MEQIIVKISQFSSKFVISASYIKPKSPGQIYLSHTHNIESSFNKYPDHQPILLGDYNLPNIYWKADPLQYSQLAYTEPAARVAADIVCESCSTLNLTQHYQTHPAKGYSLDLLFAPEGIITPLCLSEQLLPTDIHHVACAFEIETLIFTSTEAH